RGAVRTRPAQRNRDRNRSRAPERRLAAPGLRPHRQHAGRRPRTTLKLAAPGLEPVPEAGRSLAAMDGRSYERLSLEDTLFLIFETPNTSMHIGGIAVFEDAALATPDGGLDIERVRAHIGSRLRLIPRYRQRLASTPIEGHPVWVDDESFDISYHVRHL